MIINAYCFAVHIEPDINKDPFHAMISKKRMLCHEHSPPFLPLGNILPII